MTDSVPIIMIHYGPAGYLRETLRAAVRSNPDKEIFFLGDESNRIAVPSGVRYFPLADFQNGPLLTRFRSTFRPLFGTSHRFHKEGGVDTWLRFVFERWFIVLNFLRSQNIEKFWIFDSDTLIGGSLAAREDRFARFDATEQCNGNCLNGLIPSRELVEAYVGYMAEIFQNGPFLEEQQERLREHPGLAFTEMDAWQSFRDENRLSTWHLQKPLANEAFDDALGMTRGWIQAEHKIRGRIPIKKILIDPRGGYFAFPDGHSEPVRLVTLNLSWLPDYLYSRLSAGCRPGEPKSFDLAACRLPDLEEPLKMKLYSQWKRTWQAALRIGRNTTP